MQLVQFFSLMIQQKVNNKCQEKNKIIVQGTDNYYNQRISTTIIFFVNN